MILLVIAIIGLGCGYLAIWSAVVFNETIEDRARSILLGTVIDVIMLIIFTMNGSGVLFTWVMIFKYLFLSIVNFNKTLRQ